MNASDRLRSRHSGLVGPRVAVENTQTGLAPVAFPVDFRSPGVRRPGILFPGEVLWARCSYQTI